MLGLQTSYDIKNVSRLTASSSQASSNKKSHKFTKQLINRFDVTGVSNSLEKHENYKVKMGEVDSDQPVKVVNKQSQFAHEDLTKRQNAEMQRDQERLAELEEKLQEIQRKKELRRARDRNRRKRRMEFMAAGKIQKCFRGFAHRKLVIAANIVTHFIKVVKNRNALTVGSWAATVIARFAKYATSVFQDGKEANEQAEKMRTLWEMAATKLKAETETRKAVAHSISMYSLRQGLVTVAKKRIVELRDISRKKKKDQKWRGRGKGGTKTSLRKSKLSPKSSESKEKFFLTETSGDEGSTYSSDNSCSPISTANNTTSEMVENSRKNFVDVANIPMMPQINNDVGFSMEISEIGMDLMNFDDEPYDEEAELEKERLKELANTHAQREAEMQKERAARLAAIERKKKGKAREEAKRLKQETAEREARDNARYEWLDRQEDKRMEHASNLTKKRKAQEREIKRVQRELELMRKEDKEKKKPELMPKIKIKRPRTPTDYEMEMAYLKEQEEIEKKEAAAKKIYDQNKEATKKRLEARAEKDKKEKEFEEEKAKVKKDKQKKTSK